MARKQTRAAGAVGSLKQDSSYSDIMRILTNNYTVDQLRSLIESIGSVNLSLEPDVAVVEYLGDFVLRYEDDFTTVLNTKFSDLPLLVNSNERQKFLLRWRLANGE